MKKILFIALSITVLTACTNTRKIGDTTNKKTEPVTKIMKPDDGIYPPAEEELQALKGRFQDLTLATLKEGYIIYSTGACIGCHNAKNIYRYDETQWKHIMDDMAAAAKINAAQKDAVYKYVLSIKASQTK